MARGMQHRLLIMNHPHTAHCCAATGRDLPTSLAPGTRLLQASSSYMSQPSHNFAAAARAMQPFSSGG